jgi:6-pyruvoyltetrahydropterin/6-carboxytetrahydropterin synthase
VFSAGIRDRLRAVHSLAGAGPDEAVSHAHDYVIGWSCATAQLDEHGYSVDIAHLKRCLADLCRRLQDTDLNGLPFFADRPPSVENLAVFAAAELRRSLGDAARRITRCEITVWETEDAWASYSEDWTDR